MIKKETKDMIYGVILMFGPSFLAITLTLEDWWPLGPATTVVFFTVLFAYLALRGITKRF